jgi:hypothetical protein
MPGSATLMGPQPQPAQHEAVPVAVVAAAA